MRMIYAYYILRSYKFDFENLYLATTNTNCKIVLIRDVLLLPGLHLLSTYTLYRRLFIFITIVYTVQLHKYFVLDFIQLHLRGQLTLIFKLKELNVI